MCPISSKHQVLELSTCLQTTFCRKIITFLYAQAKVLLPNWPYWPWDHITFSERKLILLEKRYQKHEIWGFLIFQILLQLIHFSVNIWEPYGSIWKASGGTKGYQVPGTKRYRVPGTKLLAAYSAPAGAFLPGKNTSQDFGNTSFLDFVIFSWVGALSGSEMQIYHCLVLPNVAFTASWGGLFGLSPLVEVGFLAFHH
jgi:hypothetical protein